MHNQQKFDAIQAEYVERHRTAVANERAVRSRAWWPFEEIGGVRVAHLTLLRYELLLDGGNAFVLDVEPSEGDIAQLLWLVLEDFDLGKMPHDGFLQQVCVMNFVTVCDDIKAYLSRELYDLVGTPPTHVPIAHWLGSWCDTMAAAYGWLPEQTLNAPLPQLVQMSRCRRLRKGDNTALINPSNDVLLAQAQALGAARKSVAGEGEAS